MKKSFTLLTSALLLGASLSASAEVNSTEWKEGNYFHLKSGTSYLSLDKTVKDSVIVTSNSGDTKFERDLALWQITERKTSVGLVYQFKNKATKALLAFSKKEKATTKLDPNGIREWTFKGGQIKGFNDVTSKDCNLVIVSGDLKITEAENKSTSFDVVDPGNYDLKISELGDGFSTFFMNFKEKCEGNIFVGKELVAKEETLKDGYFKLQYKDDAEFPNGTPKYLGIDTVEYSKIPNQQNVFGCKFKVDSTYTKKDKVRSWSNADFQMFKFAINLKNDVITLLVKDAPVVETKENLGNEVQVVYAEFDDKNILTAEASNIEQLQGSVPTITTKRGNPDSLTNGTGVYFMKNGGYGVNGGKYYYTKEELSKEAPVINAAEGQWYIKENNKKYTIASRAEKGCTFETDVEIFAVKGIENAYTISGSTDTIVFEYQPKVDLNNKFLGSLHFTAEELKKKAIQLELKAVGGTVPVALENSYLVAANDTDAVSLRLVNPEINPIAGAQSLGDTIFSASYNLEDLFGHTFLTLDKEIGSLKMSDNPREDKLRVTFKSIKSGEYYKLIANEKYVSYNTNSNLVLENEDESVNFVVNKVNAHQYMEVQEGSYIRLESNGQFLTMNPYTMLAEMKMEGQPITKAGYLASHFAMKIEKAPLEIPGEPVYLISTTRIGEKEDNVLTERFYLAPMKDKEYDGNTCLGFIPEDEAKIEKDSPAYFAFRKTEEGTVLLENVNKEGSKYVSQRETKLVLLEKTGLSFNIVETSDPTPNEVIEPVKPVSVVAVGGHGSVTVMNAKDKKIVITDILGKIVGNYRVTNDRFTVPVSRGLVIVAIEGEVAQKVIVK